MREQAFISLGSNIEPELNLVRAARALAQIGRVLRMSRVYQSPAAGGRPQADYLNAAALLEVQADPAALRRRLRRIEAQLGRVRSEDRYAPRTIDLDLVLLGDRVLHSESITLPDPQLLTMAHVAVPVAELAPDRPHPVTGEPLAAIAERLRTQAKLSLRADLGGPWMQGYADD